MLSSLTAAQAKDSVLSAKEWVLLSQWKPIVRYIKNNARLNVGYTDEVKTWLREELTIEILQSNKQASRLLKLALAGL